MKNAHKELIENKLAPGEKTSFKYFFIVLAMFSATWVTANIAAVKLVSVLSITLTGGFLIFPLTTMFGNIIVEVYGYKNARQAIWSGVVLNITFVVFIYVIYLVPSSPLWGLNEQFKNVLVPGMRIALASIISFVIAEFVNSYLMAKMKMSCNGKSLVKRILISCCLSFFFDIILFLIIALYGTIPNAILGKLIFYAYLKKIFCQVALFPLACYLVLLLKKAEGVDVYDYNTKFNPFMLDNVYEIRPMNSMNLKDTKLYNGAGSINHATT